MRFQRIITLVKFDLLNNLFRLKGLVFLIPFLLFWYWIFRLLITQGTDFLVSTESIIITSWLFTRNQELAQSLMVNYPASLSVFLIITVLTTPFFVMLAGNDQLASDAGRKSFRYILTRCVRLEIFSARFISAYCLYVGITLCIGIIMTIISLHHDNHSLSQTLQYSAQVILIILVYALPFFAFMAAVSAFMSSALGTLLISVVIYVFLNILEYYLPDEISLLPSGLKDNLYTVDLSNIALHITGLFAYTLIYISLGWLIFKKRDL